jgi:hypothetical protein
VVRRIARSVRRGDLRLRPEIRLVGVSTPLCANDRYARRSPVASTPAPVARRRPKVQGPKMRPGPRPLGLSSITTKTPLSPPCVHAASRGLWKHRAGTTRCSRPPRLKSAHQVRAGGTARGRNAHDRRRHRPTPDRTRRFSARSLG